jgi:hypothetical protein
MKTAMALMLVLGVALPAAGMAQESAAQQPPKQDTRVAKAPARVGGPTQKQSSERTRHKAAQVPSQVSAGNPTAAAQKREARTADGPASNDEATDNVSKKTNVKKKKTADLPPDDKAKPQS